MARGGHQLLSADASYALDVLRNSAVRRVCCLGEKWFEDDPYCRTPLGVKEKLVGIYLFVIVLPTIGNTRYLLLARAGPKEEENIRHEIVHGES